MPAREPLLRGQITAQAAALSATRRRQSHISCGEMQGVHKNKTHGGHLIASVSSQVASIAHTARTHRIESRPELFRRPAAGTLPPHRPF
jgi:hypothetical protein